MKHNHVTVYIGAYTDGKSQGLSLGDLDITTGQLTLTGTAASLPNPSFLAVDPQRLRLYSVSEVDDFGGQHSGAVSAYALDSDTGIPTLLNSRSSGGAGPCHLSVDPAGRFVLAANYGGGSVVLLPLLEDGSLAETSAVTSHAGSSVHPTRQSSPHAHFIAMDPASRYALALDLGTDAIEVYEVDVAQNRPALRPWSRIPVRAGGGPRHLEFHPTGRYLYVINELDSTLTAYRYDQQQGSLTEIQSLSTLPPGFTGSNFPSEIHFHPSGLFLYGSNRGHDSIAMFRVDPETGQMTLRDIAPACGRTPRGFAIDPTGAFVVAAHQNTDSIVTFTIDPVTGDLAPTGCRVRVPNPVCVRFLCLS
jgi:6-phosphogluconolactonase